MPIVIFACMRVILIIISISTNLNMLDYIQLNKICKKKIVVIIIISKTTVAAVMRCTFEIKIWAMPDKQLLTNTHFNNLGASC